MNRMGATLDKTEKRQPVFIVGAGRSGTTLFYKLLCLHPEIGWISNYVGRLPGFSFLSYLNKAMCPIKLSRAIWFTKDSNAYYLRKNIIKKLYPMPVEGESVYNACDIPVFPSSAWRITEPQKKSLNIHFEKIRTSQKAKIFISKRTANNRRIPQLLEAFPNCKFIHVVRDGRAVCRSLLKVDWWENHQIYWKDMKTPQQLKRVGEKPVHLAARNWVEEMKSIQEGFKHVPSEQVMEVRYEDFCNQINDILLKVVNFIGLDDHSAWLDIIKSIEIVNKNHNRESFFKSDDLRAVIKIQRNTLKQLGYII